MLGLLALAVVLPKFVQPDRDPSEARTPEYARPVAELELLPEYTPASDKAGENEGFLQRVKEQKHETDYDKLMEPFLVRLQNGDVDGAELTLVNLKSQLPSSIHAGLQFSLESARESQKAMAIAKAETAKAVQATKQAALLAKVNEEKRIALETMKAAEKSTASQSQPVNTSSQTTDGSVADANFKNESAEKIKASLVELKKATEAAKAAAREAEKSARETARLKALLTAGNTAEAGATEKETILKNIEAPVELPEGTEVNFGFNSSVIPQEAKSAIAGVAETLKDKPLLGVQLRGYSDSVGNPQYNAILSRARSQKVQDALTDLGVSLDRIDIIPFGSSQSPRGRSADHRRVDLVFVALKDMP